MGCQEVQQRALSRSFTLLNETKEHQFSDSGNSVLRVTISSRVSVTAINLRTRSKRRHFPMPISLEPLATESRQMRRIRLKTAFVSIRCRDKGEGVTTWLDSLGQQPGNVMTETDSTSSSSPASVRWCHSVLSLFASLFGSVGFFLITSLQFFGNLTCTPVSFTSLPLRTCPSPLQHPPKKRKPHKKN